MDILLTHPNEEMAQTMLGKLLAILQLTGLISAVLTSNRDTSGKKQEQDNESRWSHASMCIVCLPDDAAPPDIERPLRHRRMDLKVCLRCKGVSEAHAADARPLLYVMSSGLQQGVDAVRAALLYGQRPLQSLDALLGQAGASAAPIAAS